MFRRMIQNLLLFSIFFPIALSMSQGSVYVTGQLKCKGQPYISEPVRIYEKNYILGDPEWTDTTTDGNGNFTMKVWGSDWISITPYIYIPNYCGTTISISRRCTSGGIQINIPDAYITEKRIPEHEFNIGTIELYNNEDSERLGLGSILWGVFAKTMECRDY